MSSNLISRSSGQQTRKGFVAIQKNSPFFLPRYLMVGYLGFYFYQSSPGIDGDNYGYAYHVRSNGDVDADNGGLGVTGSYGRFALSGLIWR